MVMARMLVRMDVGLTIMAVGVDMDEVMLFQEWYIFQHLFSGTILHDTLIFPQHDDPVRDLGNDVDVLSSGY
jgi:hypothetical protein